MPAEIALDDIISLFEAAQILGIPKGRLDRYAERTRMNGFPEPVRTLHSIRLYSRKEVEAWYKQYINTRPGLSSRSRPKYRGWTEERGAG